MPFDGRRRRVLAPGKGHARGARCETTEKIPRSRLSNRSAALEVVFDLLRVLAVEPLQFFVEDAVALVDKVNVAVLVDGPPSAVVFALLSPAR